MAYEARASYELDENAYLSSGEFTSELLAEAEAQGVAMFAEDDRLLCYPLLLRVLPNDAAIEIDRKRERRLRPSVVVAALAAAQSRPPRSKAEPFLESLAGPTPCSPSRRTSPTRCCDSTPCGRC